jgi:hypothetical protein
MANDPVKPEVKAVKASPAKKPAAKKPAAPKAAAVKKPIASKPVAAKTAAAKPAMAKPAAKPAAKPVKNPSVPASAKKVSVKKEKPHKVKMERDSFTMPKDEYAQLAALKDRLAAMGQPAKKSELLRAGIKLLSAMSDNTLKTTMANIPVIKTGRPKKK